MNKLCIIIVVFTLLASCHKSPEQKAQKKIQQLINDELQPSQQYMPITFSTLDSAFTSVKDLPRYNELTNLIIKYEQLINENQFPDSVKQIIGSSVFEAEQHRRILINTRQGNFKGWKMTHSYAFKNNDNKYEYHKTTYYFNPDMSEIKAIVGY